MSERRPADVNDCNEIFMAFSRYSGEESVSENYRSTGTLPSRFQIENNINDEIEYVEEFCSNVG